MELARTEDDHCPHCVDRFEIVRVKFRFARYPTMVVVCPSCAYTANWGNPPCGSVALMLILPKSLRKVPNFRFWHKPSANLKTSDGRVSEDVRVSEDGRVAKPADKLE